MFKQAVANGFGIQISADAGSGVVVELEEHRAEIVDQTINGTCNMLACFGGTEIKQITTRITHTHAMALKERGIRQRACQRRFHADHFRFKPQAQAHAVRTDVFGKTAQTGVAETVGGSLPFADHVPPAAVRAVVPAGVDAENIRANACRAFDQRQFLLNTWVTEQRVHVIVVDYETLRAPELLDAT